MSERTWKSVDQKKPPNGVRVLVAFDLPEWGVFIAQYFKETPIASEHWHFDNAAFNLLKPSFWMPLPEPPESEDVQ